LILSKGVVVVKVVVDVAIAGRVVRVHSIGATEPVEEIELVTLVDDKAD
jgi:hypothetical protein